MFAYLKRKNWNRIIPAALLSFSLAGLSTVPVPNHEAIAEAAPPICTSMTVNAAEHIQDVQRETLAAAAAKAFAAQELAKKQAEAKVAAEKAAAAKAAAAKAAAAKAAAAKVAAEKAAAARAAAARAAAEKAAAEARARAEAAARAAAEARARAEAEARARAAAQAAWNFAHRWVKPIWSQCIVSSVFGSRTYGFHYGIDLATPVGTPVHSITRGTVVWSGWDTTGFGYLIVIRNWDGSTIKYGHNSRLLVGYGQNVVPGQLISYSGSTGNSTGPHLHIQTYPPGVGWAYNSGAVNPRWLLANHGVYL